MYINKGEETRQDWEHDLCPAKPEKPPECSKSPRCMDPPLCTQSKVRG